MKRIVVGTLLVLSIVVAPGSAASSYKRLYVFGDSFSDIGAGYVDGNGPTAVAYLAQRMGIPFTHSTDPNANSQGIDFAVSGARTGEGEGDHIGTAFMHKGLMTQVRDFEARVKSGAIGFDPETTLFFFAGGLNDHSVTPEVTVKHLAQEVEILRQLGARHFTVALLPERIPDFAAQGARLNPALRAWVGAKGDLDLTLNNWGPDFDQVLEHAADSGFTNTTDACAGREIFHEDTTEHGDPARYYYYHGGHPSTAVHRIVGDLLFTELTGTVEAAKSPAFTFTALDGRVITSEKLRGKVVLLDFWATWCGPCVAALPEIKRLDEIYQAKGLTVIGVSLDYALAKAKLTAFCAQKGYDWPQSFDGCGPQAKLAADFGVTAIPATILIGRDGAVVARNLHGNMLKGAIEKLLVP